MWNFWVEKKVPHFFLKWAFVVLLVLPQKCAFTIAKHTKIRLFRQDFGNLLKMQWHAASSDFCMHCPSSRSGLLYDTWNLLLWNWEHIFGCLIRQLIRSSTTACICFLESRNTSTKAIFSCFIVFDAYYCKYGEIDDDKEVIFFKGAYYVSHCGTYLYKSEDKPAIFIFFK